MSRSSVCKLLLRDLLRFSVAAMMDGRNNRFSFLWEKISNCSCHATWLPCKTSIKKRLDPKPYNWVILAQKPRFRWKLQAFWLNSKTTKPGFLICLMRLNKTYAVSFFLLSGGISYKLLQKSLHSPGELSARSLIIIIMYFDSDVCDVEICCDMDLSNDKCWEWCHAVVQHSLKCWS